MPPVHGLLLVCPSGYGAPSAWDVHTVRPLLRASHGGPASGYAVIVVNALLLRARSWGTDEGLGTCSFLTVDLGKLLHLSQPQIPDERLVVPPRL